MGSDRRIDSSITSGSQRVTTPGYGAKRGIEVPPEAVAFILRSREVFTRQRRLDNCVAILTSIASLDVTISDDPNDHQDTLPRYLLLGSMAGVELPEMRHADDDTQIEMASTQIAHPVSVYDLDTGEKISLIP